MFQWMAPVAKGVASAMPLIKSLAKVVIKGIASMAAISYVIDRAFAIPALTRKTTVRKRVKDESLLMRDSVVETVKVAAVPCLLWTAGGALSVVSPLWGGIVMGAGFVWLFGASWMSWKRRTTPIDKLYVRETKPFVPAKPKLDMVKVAESVLKDTQEEREKAAANLRDAEERLKFWASFRDSAVKTTTVPVADVVADKGVVSETTVPVMDVEASRTSAVDDNFNELQDMDDERDDKKVDDLIAALNIVDVKANPKKVGIELAGAMPNDERSLMRGQAGLNRWRKDAAISASQSSQLQSGYDTARELRLQQLRLVAV